MRLFSYFYFSFYFLPMVAYAQTSSSFRITATDDLLVVDMATDTQKNIYALVNITSPGISFDGVAVAKMTPDQNILWVKRIGDPTKRMRPKTITVTQNQDILVGFDHYESAFNTTSITVARIRNNGLLSWQKSYGADFTITEIWDIIELTDGNLLIAGNAEQNGRLYDWYFVKTNAEGDLKKGITLGGSNYEYLTQVVQATDGSIFAVGRTSSFSADGTNEAGLVHLDTSLQVLKTVRMVAPEYSQEILHALAPTSAGGIVFSGQFGNDHHYFFWDGQATNVPGRIVGTGECTNIFPSDSRSFVVHNNRGLIYRISENDDYEFLYVQDDSDLGRGDRASVRMTNGQMWYGGWVVPQEGSHPFTLMGAALSDGPGCSGYYSTPVDTIHKSYPTLPLSISAEPLGQDTSLNLPVSDISWQREMVCRRVCSGLPNADFNYSLNGLQANFSLENTYDTDSTRITWHVEGAQYLNQSTLSYTFPLAASYEVCVTVETPCGRQVSCTTINPLTTQWAALEKNQELDLWPVPTHNYLRAHWSEQNISEAQAYDQYGRKISVSFAAFAKNQIELDVSGLPAGIYQLILVARDGKMVGRPFVKQ